MVLLSDRDLVQEIVGGGMAIDPFDKRFIQPASIDVRLGDQFRVFASHRRPFIDPREGCEDLTTLVETADEGLVLHPGEFVLGTTVERITLGAHLAGRLEGKSSLGRLGLVVHSTAGFIDPGFSGQVTLELSNVSPLPIMLWPDMRIGQLCVMRLVSPSMRPYGSPGLGSRYQHQQGPTPSRAAPACGGGCS